MSKGLTIEHYSALNAFELCKKVDADNVGSTDSEIAKLKLFAIMDRKKWLLDSCQNQLDLLTEKEQLELRNIEVMIPQFYSDWKD